MRFVLICKWSEINVQIKLSSSDEQPSGGANSREQTLKDNHFSCPRLWNVASVRRIQMSWAASIRSVPYVHNYGLFLQLQAQKKLGPWDCHILMHMHTIYPKEWMLMPFKQILHDNHFKLEVIFHITSVHTFKTPVLCCCSLSNWCFHARD